MHDSDDDNDDSGLFRRLFGDSKPLDAERRVPAPRRRAPPRARFARADERAVLEESLAADVDDVETGAGERLRFSRAAVGRRTMRRLSRGSYSVQDELDLHGMTAAEAEQALREFIDECHARGRTCVRVVHGKGHGSGVRGPVLKAMVNSRLRRWPAVQAFVSARQVDGGTGAVYVLLKKR